MSEKRNNHPEFTPPSMALPAVCEGKISAGEIVARTEKERAGAIRFLHENAKQLEEAGLLDLMCGLMKLANGPWNEPGAQLLNVYPGEGIKIDTGKNTIQYFYSPEDLWYLKNKKETKDGDIEDQVREGVTALMKNEGDQFSDRMKRKFVIKKGMVGHLTPGLPIKTFDGYRTFEQPLKVQVSHIDYNIITFQVFQDIAISK